MGSSVGVGSGVMTRCREHTGGTSSVWPDHQPMGEFAGGLLVLFLSKMVSDRRKCHTTKDRVEVGQTELWSLLGWCWG